MSAFGTKLRLVEGDRVMFWCPGCNKAHMVSTGPNGWTFNGDGDRPTFSPSVLVRHGHFITGHSGSCWCKYNAEHPEDPVSFKCLCCHSFVTDGQIQFLSDCSHELAGKTVPLPDYPSGRDA